MKKTLISSLLSYWQHLLYPPKNYGVEVVVIKNINPGFVFKRENQS
jgi:hypothetical protein